MSSAGNEAALPGMMNEIAAASTTARTDPAATRSARFTIRLGQPITTAAAPPRTGSINGATSMAPMTTAVESPRMPNTAIAVESIIRETKRVKNWRPGIPRGNNRSMTSLRSSSPRSSRPRHSRFISAQAKTTRPLITDTYGAGGDSCRLSALSGVGRSFTAVSGIVRLCSEIALQDFCSRRWPVPACSASLHRA